MVWFALTVLFLIVFSTLLWRHNGRDGVSNHQPPPLFTQRVIQAQIKENIKAPVQ